MNLNCGFHKESTMKLSSHVQFFECNTSQMRMLSQGDSVCSSGEPGDCPSRVQLNGHQ